MSDPIRAERASTGSKWCPIALCMGSCEHHVPEETARRLRDELDEILNPWGKPGDIPAGINDVEVWVPHLNTGHVAWIGSHEVAMGSAARQPR